MTDFAPRLQIDRSWFVDPDGRTVQLRGVNLAGSSKVPATPDGSTQLPDDFTAHRDVSFVGRPFPVAGADEHFARLRHWGFNVLRFLVPWEAVEHAGPGEYDQRYLDSVTELVERAGSFGFNVVIDPHQDVWSRMTGGDGAPGWTLEAAGFAVEALDHAEAANTMQRRGDRYQSMSWLGNQSRLACATMFTLFFAGDRFAPDLLIGGQSAQTFLQDRYIEAYQQVAARLAGLDNVVGYGVMNEPSSGYIGLDDLSAMMALKCDGPAFTGLESMAVGSGIPLTVPLYSSDGLVRRPSGTALLNPDGVSAWREPDLDVWQQAGVWRQDGDGQPVLLRPQHFAGVKFLDDAVRPFARRFVDAIRSIRPGAHAFLEGAPGSSEVLNWPARDARVVNANHWYDMGTLLAKRYDAESGVSWFDADQITTGRAEVRASYVEQIGTHVRASVQNMHGCPTFLGEFGLPFDLRQPNGLLGSDYAVQVAALAAYFDAVDLNLVHGTMWNYCPDNTHRFGDRWNGEDLSLFSLDDQVAGGELGSGGRAVRGFCRPFVTATAGILLRQCFDLESRVFEATIEAHPAGAPTTVFVPQIHYPDGALVQFGAGLPVSHTAPAQTGQRLIWPHGRTGQHSLRISPA